MRLSPSGPWRSFKAEQIFSAGLDFRWKARTRMGPWLPITILDAVESNRGILAVKLFGVIPVIRYRGPELDKGEIMRAMAEMPWRPQGFIEQPNLSWEETGKDVLTAAFSDGRIQAGIRFHIDADGRVLGVDAPDRPRIAGGKTIETPWSGVFTGYEEIGGIRIPTSAEVTWRLPGGDFPCWRAHVDEFCLL